MRWSMVGFLGMRCALCHIALIFEFVLIRHVVLRIIFLETIGFGGDFTFFVFVIC